MNLSKQIKQYREQLGFSQEALAEKIYVSRQTISNWENERSYPDVHNLLLLSVLFDVSLDELVKGDVEQMKEKISWTEMNRYTKVMLVFLALMALSIGPVLYLGGLVGVVIPLTCWLVAMGAALKIEKIKKTEDVQTYKEIIAFMEEKDVVEARALRNPRKDGLHKLLIVGGVTLVFVVIILLGILPFVMTGSELLF